MKDVALVQVFGSRICSKWPSHRKSWCLFIWSSPTRASYRTESHWYQAAQGSAVLDWMGTNDQSLVLLCDKIWGYLFGLVIDYLVKFAGTPTYRKPGCSQTHWSTLAELPITERGAWHAAMCLAVYPAGSWFKAPHFSGQIIRKANANILWC